jgi:hypothetical protein
MISSRRRRPFRSRSSRRCGYAERSAALRSVTFCSASATHYPLVALLEGETAILNAAGPRSARRGASGFLGEMNLASGQTVYLTAVVTKPMRYIAVDPRSATPRALRVRPAGGFVAGAGSSYATTTASY